MLLTPVDSSVASFCRAASTSARVRKSLAFIAGTGLSFTTPAYPIMVVVEVVVRFPGVHILTALRDGCRFVLIKLEETGIDESVRSSCPSVCCEATAFLLLFVMEVVVFTALYLLTDADLLDPVVEAVPGVDFVALICAHSLSGALAKRLGVFCRCMQIGHVNSFCRLAAVRVVVMAFTQWGWYQL